jgi:hypothetical protein
MNFSRWCRYIARSGADGSSKKVSHKIVG